MIPSSTSLVSLRSPLAALALALSTVALSGCGSSTDDQTGTNKDPPGEGPTTGVYLTAGTCISGGFVADCSPTTDPLCYCECDPLVPTECGFPFPSNVYLADDASMPSGKRVQYGKTTLPKTLGTRPLDPDLISDKDGFSVGSPALTHLPGAVATGLVDMFHIADSLKDDCASILIEADTGRHVPHWVDLDMSTTHDGTDGVHEDERSIMIRPAERLKDQTRYIAAFRHVMHRDGGEIEPSQAFKELRDNLKTKDYSVKRRRALYGEDIFPALKAANVDKADLQIAWDFTTASRENTTHRLVELRDLALADVGADGPTYTVANVEEAPGPGIARRITVTMQVPQYLTDYWPKFNTDPKAPKPVFNVGTDGKLAKNGTMPQDVLIIVPDTISDPNKKHGLLQNGHGLFGSKTEGQGGYLATIASQYGYIAFATDFFGFASPDVTFAINALGARPELFTTFFARQTQGHVNQLLAMRMMMGRVARDGIKNTDGSVLLPAGSIDPSIRAYRGDSQGGIMGSTYMSISTDVTRGLVGEPGMPYSLLLNRSQDWPAYGTILGSSYITGLNIEFMIAIIQQGWDRTEPIGPTAYMTEDTLPMGDDPHGTPAHHVLIHDGIGDHQVTTYGAAILARTIGAVNLQADDGKLNREVFAVAGVKAPLQDQSAMIEYEFGLTEPVTNIPATAGADPHDRVRQLTPSYIQQDVFFRTGQVTWTCDGVCNCDGPNEELGCPESL